MKSNYSAWKIDHKEFEKQNTGIERLRFLIRYAVLAPSSHNTQPWYFKISQNRISVFKDKSKLLPIADTNDRQSTISIGCAIQNILTAAHCYGFNTRLDFIEKEHSDSLVDIIFEEFEIERPHNYEVLRLISQRRSNRGKHTTDVIPQSILNEIKQITFEDVKLFIIDKQEMVNELGEIAVAASIESMVSDEFRAELSHHVKHNFTKSKVGMPGFSQGIPAPISFILPGLLKRFNMEKVAEKQNINLFQKWTKYLLIIASKNDTEKDWINVGRLYELISFICTKHTIALAPWGAPIQIGLHFTAIQKVINTDYRPQMFVRMGITKHKARFSPRVPFNEVIK